MRHHGFLFPVIMLMGISCSSQPAAPAQRASGESDAAVQQKDQYQEKAEARIRELSRKIDELNAQASKEGKEVRKRLEPQVAALDRQRAAAQQQLEKLKNTSQQAWRDMKPNLEAAMKNLQDAYERAARDFKQSR